MKILNITFNNAKGGLEQAFIDYTRILQSYGHEVTCVTCENAAFLPDLLEATDNVIYSRYIRTKYLKFMLRREIAKIIKATHAEMIIFHNEKNILSIREVAEKIPLIGVNHGGKIKNILVADRIFTVNKRTIETLTKLGYPAEKITFIGNMINL